MASEKGFWATCWAAIKEAVNKVGQDNLFGSAAALSYYTIFALPPMLLVILRTTNLFYNRETIQKTIFRQIEDYVGTQSAEQLSATVGSLGVFEGAWWASE